MCVCVHTWVFLCTLCKEGEGGSWSAVAPTSGPRLAEQKESAEFTTDWSFSRSLQKQSLSLLTGMRLWDREGASVFHYSVVTARPDLGRELGMVS
jgi:hypothetical protein